jgi:hypothetical protein
MTWWLCYAPRLEFPHKFGLAVGSSAWLPRNENLSQWNGNERQECLIQDDGIGSILKRLASRAQVSGGEPGTTQSDRSNELYKVYIKNIAMPWFLPRCMAQLRIRTRTSTSTSLSPAKLGWAYAVRLHDMWNFWGLISPSFGYRIIVMEKRYFP